LSPTSTSVRKEFEDILLNECLADSFEFRELELRPEVVEDRIAMRRFFRYLAEIIDRILVGATADEDICLNRALGCSQGRL